MVAYRDPREATRGYFCNREAGYYKTILVRRVSITVCASRCVVLCWLTAVNRNRISIRLTPLLLGPNSCIGFYLYHSSNYGLEHWGSDTQGVNTTRKFLLEWLSFLHRYVPLGIIDHELPQTINQRPPPSYRGRDDLETWLS